MGHIEIDFPSSDAGDTVRVIAAETAERMFGSDVDSLSKDVERLTAQVAALSAALESMRVRID